MAELTNKQLLDTLMGAIKQVKEEINNNKDYLKKEIQSENLKILKKIEEQKKKVDDLLTSQINLECKFSQLHKNTRKNNIVIFGLNIPDKEELISYTLLQLNKYLELTIEKRDLNNIYQLRSGRSLGTTNTPPIKIEFISYLTKSEVLINAKKLKGTNIFVSHDLSPQEREDFKVLNRHLKIAREKSDTAKIQKDKLIVNGNTFTIQNLREIDNQDPNKVVIPNYLDIEPTQRTDPIEGTRKNRVSSTGKRGNTSPADPDQEKDKFKVLRSNSSSSKSDVTTRNQQKKYT